MPMDDIARVRAMYEAFAQGDLAACIVHLDANLEIRQTERLPWGGEYRGLAGAQEFFGKLAANLDGGFDGRNARVFDAGNAIVVRAQSDREAPWDQFHATVDRLLADIEIPQLHQTTTEG